MAADPFQFSKDIYYYLWLTIIASLGIWISGVAYYLMFFVKYSRMGKYRYYLINITTWNFILCINGTLIIRKDNAHDVMNFPSFRGIVKIFNSQYLAHFFALVEHIAVAQIGVAIVVCCFFKFIHLAVLNKSERKFKLRMLVLVTVMIHIVSVLTIGIPGLIMYCPNSLVFSNITSIYPQMIEIFSNDLVDNFYPLCNPYVSVFNNIRMIHVLVVLACIFILIIWSFFILKAQQAILPAFTYNLQKMMIRMLFIHAVVPLFCTIILNTSKPLAMLGIIPVLPTEVVTVSLLILYASAVVNNALTIYSIKPYRRHLIKLMNDLLKKESTNGSIRPVANISGVK